MRAVRAEEAVGKKLAYDVVAITREAGRPLFLRGHVIRPEDVEELKRAGHYVVYVEDEGSREDLLNENEASVEAALKISGPGIDVVPRPMGEAYLYAKHDGMVLVRHRALAVLNSGNIVRVIVRRGGTFVRSRELVGVVALLPLSVSRAELEEELGKVAEDLPLVEVREARRIRMGILVTGTEVVEGKIRDEASQVIAEKAAAYGATVGRILYSRDDVNEISSKILDLLADHDAVIASGGMSVDPTDVTKDAIAAVADEVVLYGLPVKPTSMTIVAYRRGKPVVGVSAGIVHHRRRNALDILMPWIVTGTKVSRDFLAGLGDGGLSEEFAAEVGGRAH
ncbi:MAG: molybdopterin-binding protein [Desulfurococcaceae archaeon]